MDKETLDKNDMERIFAPVKKRPPHNRYTAFGKRTPSDIPPVDVPRELNGASVGGTPAIGGPPSGDGNPAPTPAPRPSPYPRPQDSNTSGGSTDGWQPQPWDGGTGWKPPEDRGDA
jgi:cell division protease FtsH